MDGPDIRKILEDVDDAVAPDDATVQRVEDVHPADIAEALVDLDDRARSLVFSLMGDEQAAEVLAESDENTQESIVSILENERIARLLDEMDPDDAADVLEQVEESERADLIGRLAEETRQQVRRLGEYAPDSAGGIMTTEFVAVRSADTVAEALGRLRDAEQPETMASVFVVDRTGRLVGVVDLKSLLNAESDAAVASVMTTDFLSIPTDADQEEAARIADRYHLESLPVVDEQGRLQGLITLDDVIDVLGEEASEDMLRLAGTGVVHPTSEPILKRLVARAPWLSVTLVGTFCAGMLIEYIEQTWFAETGHALITSTFRSLLYFIPLIGGMAGNVGSQSSAIMVRGFATGEVDPRRPGRVLGGELILALLIGLLSGVLVGLATMIIYEETWWLGLVVGIALPCAIFVAALAGTLVPFLCQVIRVDPAYASGPFLLTMNDIAAYVIYFSVAIGLMSSLGVH